MVGMVMGGARGSPEGSVCLEHGEIGLLDPGEEYV